MSHSDPPTASEVARAAAALAVHLQSSGVQFLPRANPESVDHWRRVFTPSESENQPDSSATGESVAGGKPVAAVAEQAAQVIPTATPETSVKEPVPTAAATEPTSASPAADLFDSSDSGYSSISLPLAERQTLLDATAATVACCTRCPVLVACRTQTVFGEGNPKPRFVFFGEGPGADEDRAGRPFVGKAGQLLDKIILACKLTRQDVYIMNAVKCRPPDNRNPEPEELQNCREYFELQLDTLQPEYIVCLGAVSAQTLLETKTSVGRMRGKLHSYRGSKVLVTYHPAYLLRTPAAKKATWDDLKMMLADAGIQL